MIPYGHQQIVNEDIEAVGAVLRSDFLTQGPVVPQFEQAVAAFASARHAVAVNSGTSALHIACLALGAAPGKRIWTVPNTFLASANCGRYCGAEVDFVDIDSHTRNMSVTALEQKLHLAFDRKQLPDILIPVHFTGEPCDMQAIAELAKRYRFRVIEDAAHAIGARYRGTPVGECRYSDMTVFSFHPVKVITSAEGGMVTTNDDELYHRLCLLRSHSMERDEARFVAPSDGPWYYEMSCLGFNYRMTDIQAALGLSQLGRIEAFVAERHRQAGYYSSQLQDLPLILPSTSPDARSAWHIYVVELAGQQKSRRRAVFEALRAAGIGVAVHYFPVHLQPYYRALGFNNGDYPVAEAYYQVALTVPLYPGLTTAQQDFVVAQLRKALI